jgi:tRNA (cytidine/uridine-2'-O-)-methyltransferase
LDALVKSAYPAGLAANVEGTLRVPRPRTRSVRTTITRLNMLHIALLEPKIPPNTGNIARLCAATGTALHLIGRLGFQLDDRSLRRAGLDYWEAVEMHRHACYADFEKSWLDEGRDLQRIFAFTTKGTTTYTRVDYQEADCLLFGDETHGLPAEMIARFGSRAVIIPMPAGKVRSLNLATATGIVLYEALRQLRRW